MFRSIRLLLLAMATLAGITVRAERPLGPTPQAGILLLRNGELIEGRVWQAGELYYVSLPDGEIRFQAADVECYCRDLDAAYRAKRKAVEPGNAEGHLGLAEWCLRQGLNGPAARELAEALAADPKHPRIALVERRLKLALAGPAQPTRPASPAAAAPSNDELDRLVQSLPAGTVETYTRSIQPLLLNHCGTAGCHGPAAEGSFRLLRMPADRVPTRRLTQRNLYAIFQVLDRADPAASPLLTHSIQPHGKAKVAVFANRDLAKVRQLTAWVHAVTAGKNSQPASVESSPPQVETMSNIDADRAGAKPEPDATGEAPGEPRDHPSPDGAAGDPFDPEIFNRRFFPE